MPAVQFIFSKARGAIYMLIYSVVRNNEDILLLCGGPGKDKEKLCGLVPHSMGSKFS
jgi:hypothetical protein